MSYSVTDWLEQCRAVRRYEQMRAADCAVGLARWLQRKVRAGDIAACGPWGGGWYPPVRKLRFFVREAGLEFSSYVSVSFGPRQPGIDQSPPLDEQLEGLVGALEREHPELLLPNLPDPPPLPPPPVARVDDGEEVL